MQNSNVQAKSTLENPGGGGAAGIGTAIDQSTVLGEVGKAAAKTHPGRNRSGRKQIQASRGSNEDLFVILGNNIFAGVEVFIQIEDRGHFSRDGKDGSAEEAARVVDLEGQSVAGADHVIEVGGADDALVADEHAANTAG